MNLLLTDVTVDDRPGRAVHLVDGRIAWLGDAADVPAADRVVAGEGALLTPAFVDGHVHATATGLALTGLDLSSRSSLAEALASVAAQVDGAEVLLGTGWDETGWPEGRGPTRADLDAVVGDRPAYLARGDVHSATVSPALLDPGPGPCGAGCPASPGYQGSPPTGGCASTPTTPPAPPPTPRSAPHSAGPRSGRPWTPRPPSASAACTRWPGPRCPAPRTWPPCWSSPPRTPARRWSGTGASWRRGADS